MKFSKIGNLSVIFLATVMIIGFFMLSAGTIVFRSLTKFDRMELKNEADVFVLRIFQSQSQNPDRGIKYFLDLKQDLKILESEFWIIDSNKIILASTTSLPLPSFDTELFNKSLRSDGFVYQISDTSERHIVGVAKYDSLGTFLVSYQKSNSGVNSRLGNQYFIAVVISLFITILLSFIVIYIYLRRRVQKIRETFLKINKGNLMARLPETRLDEIGQISSEFNKVADQMVSLIKQVQSGEAARMALLKELTHDLRSPIAALRGMIETLIDYEHRMEKDQITKTLKVCQTEIENMQNLTENLLFLAEMKGAKYRTKSETVDVLGLVTAEVESLKNRVQKSHPDLKIRFSNQLSSMSHYAKGDPVLLQRALRNLFDNTLRYCDKILAIELNSEPEKLIIRITDDGPGFPNWFIEKFEALANGYLVSNQQQKQISGLGLLICYQIVKLHDGQFAVLNSLDNIGRVKGAKCEIILPAFDLTSSRVDTGFSSRQEA